MSYTAWSVVFGEQPTAAKWNQLGQNDAGFKDGTNIDDSAILNRHIAANNLYATKLYNPYKFSAYKATGAGNQATTAGVAAKVTMTTERFDTGSNYDAANSRFTAPVAGFYFLNAIIQTLNGTSSTDSNIQLYKNGSLMRKGGNLKNGVYPQHQVVGFFQLAANDYIEVYFINITANDSIEAGAGTSSTFEGYLISPT